ncbi:MAG: hypothetical protein EOP59_03905 [Sphingomonadales bacterium]|nr:MAG: hypothetical protein EOP59_03905 [Sphingomonadales bacterium]
MANDDSIRCAVLTAEMRNDRGKFVLDAVDVFIVRPDGRALQATRFTKGWGIAVADDGKIINLMAARRGSKHDRPIPKSFLGRMFAGREWFSWREAEEIMKQFLLTTTYPAGAAWVGNEGASK